MLKEYTFLFNYLTDLLQEIQTLQLSVLPCCDDPCQMSNLIICRLQKIQLSIIAAQQKAEDFYLEGED